jgi:hypothetical protein
VLLGEVCVGRGPCSASPPPCHYLDFGVETMLARSVGKGFAVMGFALEQDKK